MVKVTEHTDPPQQIMWQLQRWTDLHRSSQHPSGGHRVHPRTWLQESSIPSRRLFHWRQKVVEDRQIHTLTGNSMPWMCHQAGSNRAHQSGTQQTSYAPGPPMKPVPGQNTHPTPRHIHHDSNPWVWLMQELQHYTPSLSTHAHHQEKVLWTPGWQLPLNANWKRQLLKDWAICQCVHTETVGLQVENHNREGHCQQSETDITGFCSTYHLHDWWQASNYNEVCTFCDEIGTCLHVVTAYSPWINGLLE